MKILFPTVFLRNFMMLLIVIYLRIFFIILEDDHYILKPNIYEVLDYLLVREKDFEILNEWVGVALTERDIIKCLSFQTRDGVKKLFLSLYFKVNPNFIWTNQF